jgi:transposase InsO family protein
VHQHTRRLALPLSGDRPLEPQSGRLACSRAEQAQIAVDLVSRACLRERISKVRPQPLILHADNGNAMRAATLENRLEELGVLRSFSRPWVINDNPYSESLFHGEVSTELSQAVFLECGGSLQLDGHLSATVARHMPSAATVPVSTGRPRQQHARRCWRQPEVVWIKSPRSSIEIIPPTLVMIA